jgi:hypothetical protein
MNADRYFFGYYQPIGYDSLSIEANGVTFAVTGLGHGG